MIRFWNLARIHEERANLTDWLGSEHLSFCDWSLNAEVWSIGLSSGQVHKLPGNGTNFFTGSTFSDFLRAYIGEELLGRPDQRRDPPRRRR